MEKDIIYNEDCLSGIKKLPDESIDLVVTSPPYGTLRHYTDNPQDLGRLTLLEQVPYLVNFSREIFRILKKARRYCLNVMDIHKKDKKGTYLESLLWLLVPKLLNEGFICKEIIIWYKGKRSWSKWMPTGTVPYPPNPLMQAYYQWILVFQKPGKPDYSHITKEIKKISEFRAKEEWSKWATCVWDVSPEKSKIHPAPFPVEIPYRLIKLYSFVGDVVLDPFMGSGTTAVASKQLKRHYIVYEISKKYCEIAKKRLSQVQVNT